MFEQLSISADKKASPLTTARYAHITDFTEQNSLLTINELMDTLHVDLKKV